MYLLVATLIKSSYISNTFIFGGKGHVIFATQQIRHVLVSRVASSNMIYYHVKLAIILYLFNGDAAIGSKSRGIFFSENFTLLRGHYEGTLALPRDRDVFI